MTNAQYLQLVRKCADINLQLIETLIQLDEASQLIISDELREMLEFSLETNWQTYRITTEKLIENGILL